MFISKLILVFLLSLGVSLMAYGSSEKKEEENGMPTGDIKKAPWMDTEFRVQDLYARIKSKQATISKMLEEKNQLKNDSAELKTLISAIVKEHKDLRQMTEDYRKHLSILQYRFPERNAKADRKYDRIEIKSIEEMELAVGIDGKLNRNLSRMRSQYKMESKAETDKDNEKIFEDKKPAPKNGESIEEAGSIIINK
jgi:hypothetical protein